MPFSKKTAMENSKKIAAKRQKLNMSENEVLPVPLDKLSLHSLCYQPATGIRPSPLPKGSHATFRMVQPVIGSSGQPAQNFIVYYPPSMNIANDSHPQASTSQTVQVLQATPSLQEKIISPQVTLMKSPAPAPVLLQNVMLPSAKSTQSGINLFTTRSDGQNNIYPTPGQITTVNPQHMTLAPGVGFNTHQQGVTMSQNSLRNHSAPNLKTLDLTNVAINMNIQGQPGNSQIQKIVINKDGTLMEQNQPGGSHLFPNQSVMAVSSSQTHENLNSEPNVLPSYYLQELLTVQSDTVPQMGAQDPRVATQYEVAPSQSVAVQNTIVSGLPAGQISNADTLIFTVKSPQPTTGASAKERLMEKLLLKSKDTTYHSIPVSHASLLLNNTGMSNTSASIHAVNSTSSPPLTENTVAAPPVDASGTVTEIFDCHSSVLLDKLNMFRMNGDYCDLTIEIGKSRWKSHLNVVASMSPLLHNILQSKNFDSNIAGGMTLKLPSQLNEDVFSLILDMLYKGCLDISQETVKHLLLITSYLKLSSAQAKCEQYFKKLNPMNENELDKIKSIARKLLRPIFYPNELPEASVSEAVQDVANSVVVPEDHIQDEQRQIPRNATKLSQHNISRNVERRSSRIKKSSSVSNTSKINCRSSESAGCEIDSADDYDVSSDVNDSIDQGKLSETEGNEQTPTNAKSTSSLTNLMRVASEAFRDLDHEVSTSESKKPQKEASATNNDPASNDNEMDKAFDGKNGNKDSVDTSCPTCNKVFSTVYGLRAHVRMSHGKKRFKCQFCPKLFTKKFDCRIHEQRKHTKEKPYRCTECGKGFHLNRDLQHHLKKHQEGYFVGCPICKKTFETEVGYKNHMASHGDRKYTCRHPACTRSFTTQVLRNRHEKSHSDKKPFSCDECDHSFKFNHELLRHQKTHTGVKPYRCDLCEKTFTRAEHLRGHMSTHSQERKFKCSECDRTFKQKQSLNAHKQTHVDSLNFVCDICGYKCQTRSYLKEHALSHTSDRPFECDICHAHFKSKRYLARHKKLHNAKGESDAEKFKEMNQNKRISRLLGNKEATSSSKRILPKIFNVISPKGTLQQKLVIKQVDMNDSSAISALTRVATQGSTQMPISSYFNMMPSDMLKTYNVSSTATDRVQGKNTMSVDANVMSSDQPTYIQYTNLDNHMGQNAENSISSIGKERVQHAPGIPSMSGWDCSSQQMDNTLEVSLPQEQYLPVLTAEEVLAANNDPVVHFPE